MASIFKPKRRKGGKSVAGANYHVRYRDAAGRQREVSLKVKDRQVALAKAGQLLRELEQESAGMIPAKSLRDAAQRPLPEHTAAFVGDLQARGRNAHYVGIVEFRLGQLLGQCSWGGLRDITADSFTAWRARQSGFSAKTLNEYLAAAVGFLNWMERQGRASGNALRAVQKVDGRGREVRQRRAFTDAELGRLLAVAGKCRPLYLAAVLTGLRDKELAGLQWCDLRLDEEPVRLTVRASLSKNRRAATLPLHPDLVAELRALRVQSASDRVFDGRTHRWEVFERHLKEAGIPKRDGQGRQVDFHAFRHTYCTNLKRAGVGEAVAMELMRHSDARLTAKVYTDSTCLPLAEAVAKLGNHRVENRTQNRTQVLVRSGQKLSLPVISNEGIESGEEPILTGVLCAPDTTCHEESEKGRWLQRKDSNLQHFG